MSRKYVKWMLVALALGLVVFLLVGCGGKSTAPAEQKETPKQEEPKKEEPKQEEPVPKEEPKEEATKPAEPPKTETKPAEEFKFVSSELKPEGCASCHVKVAEDKDYTLAAEVKKIQGHPQMDFKTVDQCMMCHKEGKAAFKTVIHKVHYKADSVFVSKYDGACVNCHKLSSEGNMVVGGLAPTGTKLVAIESATVDKAPEGCLSCHKKISEDKDYTLAAEVKKIQGHPQMDFKTPDQCMMCHKTGDNSFDKVLHTAHLKSDIYKDKYGGSCLNCHATSKEGAMSVKGL